MLKTAKRSNCKQRKPWIYQNPPEINLKPWDAQEEMGFGILTGSGGAAEEEHGAKERAGSVWGLMVEPGAEYGTVSQSPMTPLQDH